MRARANCNIDSRNGVALSGSWSSATVEGESQLTFKKRASPFTRAIMAEFVEVDFRIPTLPKFEGKEDPHEHVFAFEATMQLYNLTDGLNCKIFVTTLTDRALTWFTQLEVESIHSYQQLIDKFQAHFILNRRSSTSALLFYQIKQREGESLRKFMARFNDEKLNVPNLTIDFINHILVHGLKPGRLLSSIVMDPPADMDSLLKEAERCIYEEEFKMKRCQYASYHPLNVSMTTILNEIKDKFDLNYPRKMKNTNTRLNFDKYCRFHRDKGHDTEDCRHLRIEIERLIREGYLNEFLESMQGRKDGGSRRRRTPSPNQRGRNDCRNDID